MSKIRTLFMVCIAVVAACSTAAAAERGILLLAHGGNEQWNAHVNRIAAEVDRTHPTEVAFGMATRANIQGALDRLRARGATEIVAVPLFISSWSSVITSTEYLLGQRQEAPKELAIFAKMNHAGAPGAGAHGASHSPAGEHGGHTTADPTSPVESAVPIRMTRAMNDHPLVADILTDRARSVSSDPAAEAVVIVAHGPVADDENRRWLADMGSLAERVRRDGRFAAVDYLTLRDDAPKPVRDSATAELRRIVSGHLDAGRRVLVVPLLVSFGGIEKGLRERLEGLTYTMPAAALVPDDRIVTWVLEMANGR
jgi:sirohydrochlorin ferrochelatase